VLFWRKKIDEIKLPSGVMVKEATHPLGIVVKIVGIKKGDRGCSCKEHDVCGTVVEEDTLLGGRARGDCHCMLLGDRRD
jgi:hypothetical protein